MNIEFPTIKQLENAILFWMADCYGKCEYNKETHTFLATEYIQTPCYDSGGGIDSIDFSPVHHNISFLEAYEIWSKYRRIQEEVNKQFDNIPEPICSFVEEEAFELPF